MARFRINAIPTAVAEIVTGIILGKSLLDTIKITSSVSLLSNLGVILLMFLSGMEINFDLFKKKDLPESKQSKINPARIAIMAFTAITITAFALAYILKLVGLFNDVMLAMIIFMTVALGVVIATLKEKEILSRPIGQTILLTAVLGEVIPLLLLTIYASINGGWGRGKGQVRVARSNRDLVHTQVEQDKTDFDLNVRKLVQQFRSEEHTSELQSRI